MPPPKEFIPYLINFQAERERQAEEKKKAKLEKLRKFVTEGESKHEFFDPTYDKVPMLPNNLFLRH